MTIHFPDVSQYTPNVDPAQYPALIARATLSDRVADPTYPGFKAKAQAAGTVFAAYHWLNHGNLRAQAAWCFGHVGADVPVMIDAEDVAGNTGYAGPLTVDDLVEFAAEYRALGGIVSLCYLPFWYWAGPMSAPHRLGELESAGLGLVSSNYRTYTENGPGWNRYYPGAPAPVQWQYTSTPIDMNAYRGTAAEFAALLGGAMALTDEDKAWIETAIKGGHNGLTTDQLQQWLGDGVDGRDGTAVAPRSSLALAIQKLDVLAKGLPVSIAIALTDDDRAAIVAAVVDELDARLQAAGLGAKLDQLVARLAAAGDALNG